MVDPRHRKAPTLEAPPETGRSPWKVAALGVAAAAVIGLGWFIWSSLNEGRATDRWRDLARIEGLHEDPMGENGRDWLSPPLDSGAIHLRDEEITSLETFLAKQDSDPQLAAHVHALIANLQLTQILGLSRSARFDALKPRFDSAEEHLAAIEQKYSDAPMNWERLRPRGEASIVKLLRKSLKSNRAWEEAHGMKEVEPDPDTTVIFRTNRGDLRIRMYLLQSPGLAKAFIDRVCAGGYTGTSFFTKRDDPDEGFVRGGDARTRRKDKDFTDAERIDWGTPSLGDPLPPEEGRNLIAHVKGVVSAWHGSSEDDDPVQFLIVSKVSDHLNYEYTPFAKVEGASLPALDRIFASDTRRHRNPDTGSDATAASIADQFAFPVTIKKAFVYEKGVLKSCAGSADADESEKSLGTLKPDAYSEPEPPPEPPKSAVPPTPPTPAAPSMEGTPPPVPADPKPEMAK